MATQKAAVNIILGTGSFGHGKTSGLDCTNDKVEVQKIFDEFKNRGYLEFDNARVYSDGTSESFLAEMDYAGQGIIMSTKVPGFTPGDQTAAKVHAHVAASLSALKTNKVHIMYLHCPERSTPFEETLAAINEEYKKGHFEKFGLSNFTADEVEKVMEITKAKGYVQPTVYQGLYNLLARNNEAELFPVLRKYNMSFYAYSPLAGSFLIGNIAKQGDKAEAGSRFDPNIPMGKMYNGLFKKDSLQEGIDRLTEAGKSHGIVLQEIALRWLAHHSQLSRTHGDAIITGGRKLENLKKTLDFVEKGPLPADVAKAVEDIWPLVKSEAPKYHM